MPMATRDGCIPRNERMASWAPIRDDASTTGAIEKPTPIRLSYVFPFSQHDGKPRVERGGGREGEGGDPAG